MDDGEWNQIKLIKEMKTDKMNINRWNVDKWIKCKSDIMVSCDKMLVCYKKLSSHKHYLVKKILVIKAIACDVSPMTMFSTWDVLVFQIMYLVFSSMR